MRKITWQPIIVFAGLSLAIFLLATITAAVFPGKLPLEDFRGVVLVFAWIIYVYGYAIVAYRLFLAAMPLPEGEITANSRAEFTYHVYVLFYLIFFLLYHKKRLFSCSLHASFLPRRRYSPW